MREAMIRLSSVKDVQRFVSAITPLKGDFELISDQLILDARSLMGIFGFDLSMPLRLKIYEDSPVNMTALKSFLVDTTEDANEQ
jgi:hypothetical protein